MNVTICSGLTTGVSYSISDALTIYLSLAILVTWGGYFNLAEIGRFKGVEFDTFRKRTAMTH